jgi:hypothetical protein
MPQSFADFQLVKYFFSGFHKLHQKGPPMNMIIGKRIVQNRFLIYNCQLHENNCFKYLADTYVSE